MIEESQESYIASIFKPVLEHQEEMAESMINKQQNQFSEELKSQSFEESEIILILLQKGFFLREFNKNTGQNYLWAAELNPCILIEIIRDQTNNNTITGFTIKEKYKNPVTFKFMKDDQSHKVIPVLESSFIIYEPVIQNILQPIRRIKQYFSLARKISSNEYCLIKSASLNKLSSGFHQKTKSGGSLQKKINHPTIPKIYYLIESRNSFYICSKRQDLPQSIFEKFIQKTLNLTQPEIKNILFLLLQGLSLLHSHGILSRNISTYTIRINDYLVPMFQVFGSNQFQFVQLEYSSPEFLRNRVYNKSLDVFSLGIVFYFIFTNQHPFPHFIERYRNNQHIQYLENTVLNPANFVGIPKAYDLLKRMLQIEPNKRITAKQALSHPYFQEEEIEAMESMEEE